MANRDQEPTSNQADAAWDDEAATLLSRGVKALSAEDRRGWSQGVLSDRLREVAALKERLEAEYVRLVADWDQTQAWAVDGALSAPAWLAHHTPIGRHRASRTVGTARLVRQRHAVEEALASETVSVTQVESLARASGNGRSELLSDHEQALLDAASTMGEDDFSGLVKRWTSMADDQLGRANARHIFDNRYLHLSPTFGGAVAVDGLLDPEGGARLQAALEARITPDPDDDPQPRSAAQLRADALIELVDESERGSVTENRSRVRSNVNVIVDLPTLQGQRWTLRSRSDLVGIGPVAVETVKRLLCDSLLSRVITNGPSQVLDVGRATRFVSEPQRRGLIVRDGGCVFPSCNRDHRWCDAHHLTPYSHVGKTDLKDLVLLCPRHHTMVHEGGWILRRDPQTGQITAERAPP